MASFRSAKPVKSLLRRRFGTDALQSNLQSLLRPASPFLRPIGRFSSLSHSGTACTLKTVRIPSQGSSYILKSEILWPHKRHFSTSVLRPLTGQEAPSPQAYISSGILAGQEKSLVDVKKVLVIGSGGLSIGQAGEFDYSG